MGEFDILGFEEETVLFASYTFSSSVLIQILPRNSLFWNSGWRQCLSL